MGKTMNKEKKRILIGTLDYEIIKNLGRGFACTDYKIRYAQKGIDVLLEILDNEIDLLILDLELAGIMGIEMLPVIRRLRPRLPVVLIADDYTQKIRKIAAEQGVLYQAFKPISTSETDAIVSASNNVIEKYVSVSLNQHFIKSGLS